MFEFLYIQLYSSIKTAWNKKRTLKVKKTYTPTSLFINSQPWIVAKIVEKIVNHNWQLMSRFHVISIIIVSLCSTKCLTVCFELRWLNFRLRVRNAAFFERWKWNCFCSFVSSIFSAAMCTFDEKSCIPKVTFIYGAIFRLSTAKKNKYTYNTWSAKKINWALKSI